MVFTMGEPGKQKPWAIIALALAGSALLVDKFVLSASADESSGEVIAGATQAVKSDASEPFLRHGPSLADHFDRFGPSESDIAGGLETAFEVPNDFREANASSVVGEARTEEIGLRLSSILTRNGERLAIVNGRPLRVGDVVSGATLLVIDDDSVTLDTAIGPVVLDLARPSLGGS